MKMVDDIARLHAQRSLRVVSFLRVVDDVTAAAVHVSGLTRSRSIDDDDDTFMTVAAA